MKRNKEDALRWLEQADFDLKSAKENFDMKNYAYTCFMCEQSVQKALKAYLIFKGKRYVWEHSIQKLLEECSSYDNKFSEISDIGKILDKYYLTTRYPDAIAPPAVPYKSFTEKEAKEAIDFGERIVTLVKNRLGGGRNG